MQGVHRIIQSGFLFNVVAGCQEEFPRTRDERLLCFSNALREFVTIGFNESGFIQVCPGSAVRRYE